MSLQDVSDPNHIQRSALHESGLLPGSSAGVVVSGTASIAIATATSGATRAVVSNTSAVMAGCTVGAAESATSVVMASGAASAVKSSASAVVAGGATSAVEAGVVIA